jgi:hypothetical protein
MADYKVAASADDGTSGGTNPNTNLSDLEAYYNDALGPTSESYGWAQIDTSSIGSDTITAATVYWWNRSYAKTKQASYHQSITISGYEVFDYNGGTMPSVVSWESHALTSGEFQYINTSGVTEIRFYVDNPGSSRYRQWNVWAYDYDGAAGRSPYLAVTHAPAAGGSPRVSILRV